MERHYSFVIQPEFGDWFEGCGFWPGVTEARAALASAYPGAVVTHCEEANRCNGAESYYPDN